VTDPWRRQNDGNDRQGCPEGDTFRDLIPSFVITAVIIGALALAGWLAGDALGVFTSVEDGLYLGFLIAILVFLCSGLITGLRANIGGAVKSILAWMAIGLIAITEYAYRDELTAIWERIAGELSPGSVIRADRSLMMRAAANGSFFMDVSLNGQPTRMLVDTGASALALSPEDARTAGLDPARLRYDVPIRTADGATRAARVVWEPSRPAA